MVNAEKFYVIIKAYNILNRVPKGVVIWKPLQFLSPFWQRQLYEAHGNCLYNTALRTPVETANVFSYSIFCPSFLSKITLPF